MRVLAGGEFGGAGRHAVVGAAFAYRWRIVHAQARAMYMLPTTYRLTDDGSVGARIQVGAAAVAVGMHLPLGRAELHGELGLEAGASVSRGVGVPAPRTVRQPWVAPLVTLAIRRRLGGPVALIGGLEVGPLLHRAALRAPGAAYAYRAGAITSRVWLGLEFTMARDNSGGRPEKVAR